LKIFDYSVLAFRQQERSPVELVFIAKADEITTWAGVPRKSDELLAGYQRYSAELIQLEQRRLDADSDEERRWC
jgi:hypothetical protein